ncbi:MAG: LysE family translocator [Pseudomonadota bacterium]
MWIEFLITSFVVVIAPGTGVIYTVAVGLARGTAASLAAAIGCTLGIVPHMTAAIAGLAALLHTSAILFQALKWVGILYLLFLTWRILRDDGPIKFDAKVDRTSYLKVATTGFLINILNPKLSMFFLAFLPQFVTAGSATAVHQMLLLSVVFMVLTIAVFICYGGFASKVRTRIEQTPLFLDWMKRGFAAAFVILGLRLAFESC